MRLYIAGLYGSHFHKQGKIYQNAGDATRWCRDQVKWHLESYHYIKKGRYVERIRDDGVKLFLDSGAFSSWSLGVDVSIEEYAEFLRENQDIIEMASVLDAIGDPVGTFHNQNALEKMGVEVLPCFHYGEPWDLCEYYVRNYDYITIGGMVPIPNAKLEPWLDELWGTVLTDRDGYARVKVHGFGQTSPDLMIKYPWYTVDSSTWVQWALNGGIALPGWRGMLMISDSSPTRKQFGRHYNTLSAAERAYADERIRACGGMTPEILATTYQARWALNAYVFHLLGESHGEDHWRKPFKQEQPYLF